MRLRIEDVLFWLLIFMITGIIIWKLFGSPSDTAMIISVGTLIISSEIVLWRNFFRIEKNTSLGFMKVKYDMGKIERNIMSKLNRIDKKNENE